MSSSAIQVAKTATYLPDLVEVQRASFKWFLDQGLIEELESFSPITDYTGKLELPQVTMLIIPVILYLKT